jgi:hypothetical protein
MPYGVVRFTLASTVQPNPLNLRKTGNLRLARGRGFGSIFTVDS